MCRERYTIHLIYDPRIISNEYLWNTFSFTFFVNSSLKIYITLSFHSLTSSLCFGCKTPDSKHFLAIICFTLKNKLSVLLGYLIYILLYLIYCTYYFCSEYRIESNNPVCNTNKHTW